MSIARKLPGFRAHKNKRGTMMQVGAMSVNLIAQGDNPGDRVELLAWPPGSASTDLDSGSSSTICVVVFKRTISATTFNPELN